MPDTTFRYFDGHNDLLSQLLLHDSARAATLFCEGYDQGHLDLPRMQGAGFTGGLFALWSMPPGRGSVGSSLNMDSRSMPYDIPLPAALTQAEALVPVMHELALLLRLEQASGARLRRCTTVDEIRQANARDQIAAIVHLEGAEAIDTEFRVLDLLYELGLRSLGPLWSRPNVFGHGVPFSAPSSPDTGPGLSGAGKALVQYCNERRILLDLSHLNSRGVEDIAAISDAPLLASHSNAHALCPHARNLTDPQLEMIAATGGLVGLNFATAYLREDAAMNADTPLALLLKHCDYLIDKLGEAHVAIGSDFDGATIPREIGDVSGIARLHQAFSEHGYDAKLLNKLFHDNWLDLLQRSWNR